MDTGENLAGLIQVQIFRHILHARVKGELKLRFHALHDKVWQEEFLIETYKQMRRNSYAPRIDEEISSGTAESGVERWLWKLMQELFKPFAVAARRYVATEPNCTVEFLN